MPEQETLQRNTAFGIVGNEDIVLAFQALGWASFPVTDILEFRQVLPRITEKKITICLVQENIYQAARKDIDQYRGLSLPIFIPFSKEARIELLEQLIKEIRLRATGVL